MHARDLAELAALLAVHAPVLAEGGGRVPPGTSEQYWTASKCRLDRWTRLLVQLRAAGEEPIRPATLSWGRIRPALEEILVSELLTRLWAAVSVAYDVAHGEDDLGPVAQNIFSGHLDVRRRLLELLADGRAIELPEAVALNHLRRRVERWTDMLLAHVARTTDISLFAFDTARAGDFADDLDYDTAQAEHRFTCQLILASLRASFAENLADRSPNNDLNRKIGASLLGMFREEVTDSSGLVKSLWLERISRTASDTEGMIEELLELDRQPVSFAERWQF